MRQIFGNGGSRWVPRDGKMVKFWEDTWFGIAPLAVQFWELYCICNDKTKTLDRELRLTFRRTFSREMVLVWRDLLEVVEQVNLNDDIDALYWCMRSHEHAHHVHAMQSSISGVLHPCTSLLYGTSRCLLRSNFSFDCWLIISWQPLII
jgi:hypothetical protein